MRFPSELEFLFGRSVTSFFLIFSSRFTRLVNNAKVCPGGGRGRPSAVSLPPLRDSAPANIEKHAAHLLSMASLSSTPPSPPHTHCDQMELQKSRLSNAPLVVTVHRSLPPLSLLPLAHSIWIVYPHITSSFTHFPIPLSLLVLDITRECK